MIITLASQKGGTSKTTTASILLSALEQVIGIDLDPQGNLTSICGGNREHATNIVTVLQGDTSVVDAIQHTAIGELVTSSPELAKMSIAPTVLTKTLIPLQNHYRHIVIDTPPVLSDITLSALATCDMLIIPIQAAPLSLDGAKELCEIALDIKDTVNPKLIIGGILLTRFTARTNLGKVMRQAAKSMAQSFGTKVFSATIRDSIIVPEAQALKQGLYSYAPKSKVTQDYQDFVLELKKVMNHG